MVSGTTVLAGMVYREMRSGVGQAVKREMVLCVS